MVSHKSVEIENLHINHIIYFKNHCYVLHKILRSSGSDMRPINIYQRIDKTMHKSRNVK